MTDSNIVKKGTFKQLNEGKFVTNKSFSALFDHLEEHGFIEDYSSKNDIYLQEGDVIHIVTLDSGNGHRKMVLSTYRNGTAIHWILNVIAGVPMANPALHGPSTSVFSFQWVPAKKTVAEDVLDAFGSDQGTVAANIDSSHFQRHHITLDGDRGDVYRVSFTNLQEYEEIVSLMKGKWLKAAYSVIDKLGMRFPGDSVDVAVAQVGTELTVVFVGGGSKGEVHQYRVCENTARAVPMMKSLDFKTSKVSLPFYVTMVTGFQDRKRETPTPVMGWIPQLNQYVNVEGEKELYVIHDYDAVEQKFIVKKADSTRSMRGSMGLGHGVKRGDEITGFTVDGKMLSPFVLSYTP